MFDIGSGVAQDKVEAVRWFRLAAAQGNAEALQMLRLAVAQSMQPLRLH
jgi:TPR repeat protein